MRLLTWLLRAFLFFALFAFAINNQQPATVNWFFSYAWTTSMVYIVLFAFVAGALLGMLAMTPSWWRDRRRAKRPGAPAAAAAAPAASTTPEVLVVRDGL
ncbi:MAG: LapA family protein [Burkholderiaceae bacterium]